MGQSSHFEVFPGVVKAGHKAWFYRLVGANGEVIVSSEPYTTKQHAERGINDLRDAVGSAETKLIEEDK